MKYQDWRKRGEAKSVDIHKCIPSVQWKGDAFLFITDIKERRMVLQMSRQEFLALAKDMVELAEKAA
jgi:hypothetical protein